jgi:dTDP-glucose pyrophosphorylase
VTPALVVLAAGLSSRYGRPKQLEPLGPSGETLVDYSVFDAQRAGFGRVVLVIRRELEAVMRAHAAERWGGVDVRHAFQETGPGRTKPWGTAEAVLAAGAFEVPFGVCNADDFYGAAGFRSLAAHLRSARHVDSALVGYRLADTLSPHGGVSRALCVTDRAGRLTALTELHDVRRAGDEARGAPPDGQEVPLALDALVSMNLWGFQPAVPSLLAAGFARFAALHRADPAAEYPLSTAVHALVTGGRMAVRVLPAGEGWMGITHPEDRDPVTARLRRLVDAGEYPSPLIPPRGGEG